MGEKTYKIYESKGQLKVTIPKVLAQSIGLSKGDEISWLIDRGELILKNMKK